MPAHSESRRTEADDIVRYIVVVHGIGQQKKNETVRPVIERFAQARSVAQRQIGEPLTLGLLASQLKEAPVGDFPDALEDGWVEIEGIPQRPDREPAPFVGRRATRGHNLRFVDLHWASVTDDQFEAFGEPAASWTKSLIDRLLIRRAAGRDDEQDTRWILGLLKTLRAGVIPLQQFMSRRDPDLTETIFNRFLGDVQLYGEYLATRGMAVRRFHERLERLEKRHYEAERNTGRTPRDPRYTVVAHSLGSVMSFDALLFAHIRRNRTGVDDTKLLEMLPEYDRNPSTKKQDEYSPDLEWIRNVDAFVTLGSPIDKFLVLWWLNYEHLVTKPDAPDTWVDRSLLEERTPIRHYNYCDEQDPVGHAIDVAYSPGTVVERIFEKQEDRVYTRYSVPGLAHVGYWTDAHLFRRILDLTVDGRPREEASPVTWFKPWTYVQSLAWTYLLVPVAGWLVASVAMVWALLSAESGTARGFWAMVSVGVLVLTCWLMRIVVEWREILVSKGGSTGTVLPHERVVRAVSLTVFRTLVVLIPIVWLYVLQRTASSVPGPDMFTPAPRPAHDVRAILLALSGGEWWAFVSRLYDALEADLRWLFTFSPGARWVSTIIGSVHGFLIGVWNLAVVARMRLLYRGRSLDLDFVKYVRNDPTRAPEERHA